MGRVIPQMVIQLHRNACEAARCPWLHILNYADPCVSCPEGHFISYQQCEELPIGVPVFDEIVEQPLWAIGLPKPGNIFSDIIYQITGQQTSGCGVCRNRRQQMNSWGWWGCWRNRDLIVNWIIEEAQKRGHTVDYFYVFDLFKAAVREMRSKQTSERITTI